MPPSSFNVPFSFVHNFTTHHSARLHDEHISPSEWGTIRFPFTLSFFGIFFRNINLEVALVKIGHGAVPANEFIR